MARRALLILVALVVLAGDVPQLAAQPSVQVVAAGLAFPTNMAFAPDGRIFFTLRLQGTPSGSPEAGSTSGSPLPGASPTSPGPLGGAGTPVGLVIAAVLISALIFMRRRIMRR